MSTEHVIDPKRIHHFWDRDLEPTLRIGSGDVVHFDLLMAGHGQVDNGTPIEEARFDFDTLYNLLGPIWVDGAEPGDTLEIEVLALQPGDWGWTVVLPELGVLPEDFPDAFIRYFDLADARRRSWSRAWRFRSCRSSARWGTIPASLRPRRRSRRTAAAATSTRDI
jgi:acetamidase/formamidase